MELYVGGQLYMILSESPGDGERNGAFAGVVARSVTQICSLEYLNLVEQF